MTIKSILVPLSEPRLAKLSLKAAITVAEPFTAHIEALHVRPDSRTIAASYMGETMSAAMVEEMIATTERKAAENARKTRAAFDATCAAEKIKIAAKPSRANAVTASWREEIGYEDQWLRTAGRLADLILLARPTAAIDVGARLSLEAALMDTGRPLLVVPPKVPARIGTNIAIAWNASAESARAVSLAMPFLDNAKKVTILTASEPGSEEYDPDSLRSLLAWHGISAKVEKVRTRGDAGKALLAAAEKAGANLLVMGAYSHSRVRELILGGVTRHVLSSADLPVFMAH
jgi:nucleotide-binding universal stress UspA family protein